MKLKKFKQGFSYPPVVQVGKKIAYPEPEFVKVKSPGIDSASLCSGPARQREFLLARQAGNRFLGSFKRFTNTGSGKGLEGNDEGAKLILGM